MANIILRIRDGNALPFYIYYGNSGREYHFKLEANGHTHAIAIPIEEWRANDFSIARDLLDQRLSIPIYPDLEIDGAPAARAENEEVNILSLANADLAKQLDEAREKLQGNEMLLVAAEKRIKELLQYEPETTEAPKIILPTDPVSPASEIEIPPALSPEVLPTASEGILAAAPAESAEESPKKRGRKKKVESAEEAPKETSDTPGE